MERLHESLLETAALLVNSPATLGSAGLRRGVSTAYYAVFSRLSMLCAQALARSRANSSSYQIAFRMLDHGPAREALNRDTEFRVPLGDSFARLQEARQWADYNPASHPEAAESRAGNRFSKREAGDLVRVARDSVALVDGLSTSARQRLAVLLVARARR
jgi:hypothetical protein